MGDVPMTGLLDHRGRPLRSSVSRGSFQDYIDMVQNLQVQPAYTLDGTKQEQVGDSFSAYVQQAYKTNGVVFAVSVARSLLLSEATFKFRRRGTAGGGNDLFGNPDLALLETPWPNGTTQDLITRMEQDVTNAGNAFVALSEDGQRLFRRRPDWCEFILTEAPQYAVEADVVGMKYTAGGCNSGGPSKLYLIEDVAHWAPIPDPIAEFRGMSWLTPVIREMQADGAATQHKLAFFENAATPNLSVSLKESVTVEQFEAFMRAMDETHSGVSNAYKTLYLGGGADVQVVGADMRQLDFRSTQGAGETRIAAAGRVPPIIVGLSEGLSAATYSNYSQARRAFGDSWARPTWRSLCGALATLIDVPAGKTLWYDDRDIAFLREDRADLAQIQSTNMATINAALSAGWKADSARDAVLAEDFTLLEHSGLLSVQLQPPPDPNAPPVDPNAPVVDDPALAEETAARARVIDSRARLLDMLGDHDPDELIDLLRAWDVRLHPRDSKGRFRKTTSVDIADGTVPVRHLREKRLDALFLEIQNEENPDERAFERIGEEWDRRERVARMTKAERAEYDEQERQDNVSALVAGGHDYLEAYAEVYQMDIEKLRQQERNALVDAERRPGESRRQVVRRQYDEFVYLKLMQAETETRGHLLTAEAESRGISAVDLFSGPAPRARKYASEDLKRWWSDNGGRLTFTEFAGQVMGGDGAELDSIRLGGNGRDFGV